MATTAVPSANWTVMDFWRPWLPPALDLVQPILPGWTLNLNSNNSTAPQTEVNVVAKHSYGRQIGRISDALRVLLLEQHRSLPKTGPLAEFMSMWEEIEQVKTESAAARLEQIGSDLALLKDKNPADTGACADGLQEALKKASDVTKNRSPARPTPPSPPTASRREGAGPAVGTSAFA